jgi:TolB-like protein
VDGAPVTARIAAPPHRRTGLAMRTLLLCVCASVASARPAFSQCPDGTPPPCRGARTAAAPAANSVAVLYFDTRDTTDRYLVDGLTEEIILRLQQLPRLEVKSRYESQRVRRESAATPAALGRTLGVRYLVNGTVQRAGERVVVRVELTRADRAVGIWSERYDQSSGNVLDVIDAIARGVATGVAGRLLPAEAADLARRPTADAVAYEQFLRGNFFLAQRTAAGFARAVEAYEASTARDPAFKPPLARAAYAYGLGIYYGVGDLPPDTVVARAERATALAMRQAPEVSDTWLAQGWYLLIASFLGTRNDMAGARAALARAVQLDPRSPEAHHQFAQALVFLAEDSLAESEYRRAVDLEPGRAVSLQELSLLSLFRERYADAVRWADGALAADPRFSRAYMNRAMAKLGLGDAAGALDDANRAVAFSSGGIAGEAHAAHAAALAASGDTAAARAEAESSVPLGAGTGVAPVPFAVLGDKRRTLDVLEAMPTQVMRCASARWPGMAALRGDPRFERLTAECPWRRRTP